MKKTIELGNEQSLTLNNNVGWTLIYRDQFGTDIIPVLMPALASIVELIGDELGKKVAKGKNILSGVTQETLTNMLIQLAGLEFTSFINIVWSMAKCEDDSIDEPKKWIKQFDVFPLDIIAPVAFEMIVSGVISSKNFESLQAKLTAMKAEVKKK